MQWAESGQLQLLMMVLLFFQSWRTPAPKSKVHFFEEIIHSWILKNHKALFWSRSWNQRALCWSTVSTARRRWSTQEGVPCSKQPAGDQSLAAAFAGEGRRILGAWHCPKTIRKLSCMIQILPYVFLHYFPMITSSHHCCFFFRTHDGSQWGKVKWRVHSLFSGIECYREAVLILQSAIMDFFSISIDVQWEIMVTQHNVHVISC